MAQGAIVRASAPAAGASIGPAVREASVTALVALVLLAPLLGMRTSSGPTGPTLTFHFGWVAIAVAVVFAGRLLLTLARAAPAAGRHRRPRRPSRLLGALGRLVGRNATILGALGLIFAFVLPFMPFSNRYIIDVGTTVLIYVMLGWGLNIVVGLAGLLDLGYVAFYAVGAYSYALLSTGLGWSFWICLPLAGLLAATFGVLWASRSCVCAATTSPSSRWASARSSASCC
jgi:branched-chain amino acid transport system permease protein